MSSTPRIGVVYVNYPNPTCVAVILKTCLAIDLKLPATNKALQDEKIFKIQVAARGAEPFGAAIKTIA
jgi:hypothetical protein